MTIQPTPPDLPPMSSAKAAPMPERPAPSPAAASSGSGFGAKRLRQIVGMIASGGLVLIVVVLFFQLVARPGLRPTDLMATIEAQTELGIFNQKMGAAPGEVLMTEAQYRAKLAEAERGGQAKAELAFQKDLAVVQADKERVVGAYQTLYQRTNLIAQAGVQMEQVAMQFRQQLLQSTNGGRAVVIGIKDMACGLGSEEACASARADREKMIDEGTTLSEADLAAKVNALMAGIPDPASLVAAQDQQQNGVPTLTEN
jgi:hypothetical protein